MRSCVLREQNNKDIYLDLSPFREGKEEKPRRRDLEGRRHSDPQHETATVILIHYYRFGLNIKRRSLALLFFNKLLPKTALLLFCTII